MTDTLSPRATPTTPLRRPAVALVAAFLAGTLTAVGQGVLPDALSSLTNSAGGWTLVTVALVAWAGVRPLPSAALGLASFFLLNAGYAALSALRGLTWSLSPDNFWVLIGFAAGPLVGLGAAWLRDRRDVLAGVSVAGLAGLLIGEGIYGLTVVADTTSPVYWALSASAGLALLTWACVRRLAGVLPRAVALAGTPLVALAQLQAYSLLN